MRAWFVISSIGAAAALVFVASACGSELRITRADGDGEATAEAEAATSDAATSIEASTGSSCNGRPQDWLPATELTIGSVSDAILHPFVSADGQTLSYTRNLTDGGRSFERANREGASATFGGQRSFAFSPPTTSTERFPTAINENELFLSSADVTRYVNGGKSLVTAASNGSVEETAPTLSADGRFLYFVRRNGASSSAIWSVRRTNPGDSEFPLDARMVLEVGGDLDEEYSFAITPDGLGIYYANPIDDGVLYATRASVELAFGEGETVPSLVATGRATMPRSITADGCELYLSSNRGSDLVYRAYVARRK